jgi:hypothetical protein
MARLRYSYSEAREEATGLAWGFVRGLPAGGAGRLRSVEPSKTGGGSKASKFPVLWVAIFVFHPPEVVADGGELIVEVNVETKDVRMWG